MSAESPAAADAEMLPIMGYIDVPEPGLVGYKDLEIAGWVAAGEPMRDIAVTLNDLLLGLASQGLARPDVGAALPRYSDAGQSGFHLRIAMLQQGLLHGPYRLTVTATTVSGRSYRMPVPLFVVRSEADAFEGLRQQYVQAATVLDRMGLRLDAYHVARSAAAQFPGNLALSRDLAGIARPGPLVRLAHWRDKLAHWTLTPLAYATRKPRRSAYRAWSRWTSPLRPHGTHALLSRFEGLGFNCEFGLIQRRYGIVAPRLLLFASIKLDVLLRGLDEDFAGLGAVENCQLVHHPLAPRDDYHLHDGKYGFWTHEIVSPAKVQADAAKVLEDACAHRRVLRDRLLEDLRTARKHFVVWDYDRLSDDDIQILFAALRRHGPNRLLCIRPLEGSRAPSSIEVLQPGLVVGYIAAFSGGPDLARFLAPEGWITLCRAADAVFSAQM